MSDGTLAALGWTDELEAAFTTYEERGFLPARVVAEHRGGYYVRSELGDRLAHATARLGEPIAELGADVVPAAMLRDDASGPEAALFIACEGRLELVGPAEVGQGSIGQRKTPSLGGRT